MKRPYGYNVGYGWKGQVDNKTIEFPTENEYIEYLKETEEEEK